MRRMTDNRYMLSACSSFPSAQLPHIQRNSYYILGGDTVSIGNTDSMAFTSVPYFEVAYENSRRKT